MEEIRIKDYTVRNDGDYYKVYDKDDKDVTYKFNDDVVIMNNNELREVMEKIFASFVKDWKKITNEGISRLLAEIYPLNAENIDYINYGDGEEYIRFYIYNYSMYIDLDVRNVRDLEIVKNIYKDGIDYIRKRVRYHDRYVIGKLLNSICENVSIETVAYFLVMLFDSDKDFYQVKWFNCDEYHYVEYIKVDYGSTYEYKEDEDNIDIEKKVIEFRDFIMNVI